MTTKAYPIGDYQVTRTSDGSSVLVRGDINAWLTANKASPTSDPNRYKIGNRSVDVEFLLPGIVERVEYITGRSYTVGVEKALAAVA